MNDRSRSNPLTPQPTRGSVLVVVLWTISVAALIVASVQLFGYRQATLGRDALHRVQARWAARAGIENTIAMMASHTEKPVPDDAWAMIHDLEFVSSYDELLDTGYDIQYHADGLDLAGPMDEHSKLNINGTDLESLAVLEDITPDVIASIRDWLDADDDPGMLGAESDWYLGQHDYKPRNGPLRNIAEMELIAGIWGEYLRGEDWDLNNRRDPNEDDGETWAPDDEPDGVLDAGWSGSLTVHSVNGGATASGLPRIYLRGVGREGSEQVEDLAVRCGVTDEQAELLRAFGRQDQNRIEQLIVTPLTFIDESGNVQETEVNGEMEPLTDEQLRAVLAETTTRPLYERQPGRINLNTASEFLLRDLLERYQYPEAVADEIIYMRVSRVEGITSILDLQDIPDVSREQVGELATIFTTRGNVYSISARGRSEVSGTEVEIIAVVDRSTLPIRILEYREQ